jgi:cytochrome c oxidase assembly factor CtaG
MKELTITAASHLIMGILGLTVWVVSLVSMRKENQFGHPMRGIFWFTLAIVCLCAVVLFGGNLERIRSLEMISRRIQATALGF